MGCNCNQDQPKREASAMTADVSAPDQIEREDEPESVKGKRWLERWMEMRRGKL